MNFNTCGSVEPHIARFTALRYSYLHDRLGSVRHIIDTSGNRRYRLGTLKVNKKD